MCCVNLCELLVLAGDGSSTVSSCHAKGAKACKSQKSEWTCVGLE